MKRFIPVYFSAVLITLCASSAFAEGSITPPKDAYVDGQPTSTMKSMNDVEPRNLVTYLPYTITNPGSYYLASPLKGTNASSGIIIGQSDVTLDLNGFSLNGVTGSVNGIEVSGEQHNITIHNGVIRGWGDNGIMAANAHACKVADLDVGDNGLSGVVLGDNVRAMKCSFGENMQDGLVVGDGATVESCKAFENHGNGIITGVGSHVTGCTSAMNWGDGIDVQMYSVVRENIAAMNTNFGIAVNASCYVVDNTTGDNGKGASPAAGILITGPGTRVKDNNVTANQQGIVIQSQGNWIENNNIVDNMDFAIDADTHSNAANNFIVRNICALPLAETAPGTNFIVGSNNFHGRIIKEPGGGFSTNNPWANFDF
ncbi:MAG: right-handed parallel beta-helix repeat-containing protein [Kiritimatiellia bacterium]